VTTKPQTVHEILTEAFHKVIPVDSWANKDKEFNLLKQQVAKIEKLFPQDAHETGLEILREFYRLRSHGDAFIKKQPFTPSGLQTVWNNVLDSLNERAKAQGEADVEDMAYPGAEDVVRSIEVMYERGYPLKLRRRLLTLIGSKPREYLLKLHDEILRVFSATSARPLPDFATVSSAIDTLGAPATYARPVKALPAPDAGVLPKDMDLGAMILKAADDERERVRVRVMAGNASEYERRWLDSLDHPRPHVPGVKHVSEVLGPQATKAVVAPTTPDGVF